MKKTNLETEHIEEKRQTTQENNEIEERKERESIQHSESTITITIEPLPKKPRYIGIYQMWPWYITAHIIVYIIIYNVYYPNDIRLHFLRLDTDHIVQVWRFFTHVFLHANVSHLIANVSLISSLTFMLGTSWHTQQWRIFILYNLSILQGAIGIGWEKRINRPDDRLIAVGASGASYGLLGMNISDLLINWSILPLRWFRLFILVVAIIGEILSWYFVYVDSITISGHLGGFIGGILSGFLLIDAKTAPDLFTKSYFSVLHLYKNKVLNQTEIKKEEFITQSQLPDMFTHKKEIHDKNHQSEEEYKKENVKEQEQTLENLQNIDHGYHTKSLKNKIFFIASAILYPMYTISGIINYFTL